MLKILTGQIMQALKLDNLMDTLTGDYCTNIEVLLNEPPC